jgi:hypothetical protein
MEILKQFQDGVKNGLVMRDNTQEKALGIVAGLGVERLFKRRTNAGENSGLYSLAAIQMFNLSLKGFNGGR